MEQKQQTNRAQRRVLMMGLYAAAALAVLTMLVMTLLFWEPAGRRTYALHLPSSADIAELVVKQGEREAHISGWDKVGAVTELLLADGRTTTNESIQDMPVNVENCIQLDYHFAGGGASTLFAYEKRNGYWLEQPYNGIYTLSQEEFGALLELLGEAA